MPVPSPDALACRLREGVALRTPYFDGPAGSQVVIDYLDVQVFGRMALRARLHSRHSSSPLSLWMRFFMSLNTAAVHPHVSLPGLAHVPQLPFGL